MPRKIDVPQSCTLLTDGPVTILLKNTFRETLLKQGIARPHQLIAAHPPAEKRYRGRGLLPAIPIEGQSGKRMVAKQCLRGGLLRFINRDIFWGGNRSFREMIENEKILGRGIRTPEIIAAANDKVFGPFYRTYLFSLEVPGCLDLMTICDALKEQPPRKRLKEKALLFEAVSRALVTMHRKGIYHGDLHLKNILIQKKKGNGAPTVFIIDFDKAVFKTALTPTEKLKNLLRFNRSLEKYKRQGSGITRGDQCRIFREYFKFNSDVNDLYEKKYKTIALFLRMRKAKWKAGSFFSSGEKREPSS